MFRLNPHSRRLKNGKHGFSLVELIVVILIIAILAVAVFAGGSAAIKKAQKARAISDLHNFQIAVAMTMNENPQIANIEAATKKDKLSAIMDALNANLPADYKVTLQTAAMDGNISMAAQDDVNADFIICKSEKTDAWDNPYFVIIDSAQRGGSAASEFYMTTLTAGPNAILNLTGAVDKDDLFDLTSYSDGDVISATYDVSEAVPTVVGGAAAATSFTDPATAPVNNGETTTFPEPEPEPIHYSISATVSNGTYDGDTTIDENGNATVTIAASAGYQLPVSVTVTGATSSYNETTGVVTLSNPTWNVTIEASCPATAICFAAGTKVLMADGTEKNIEDITAGEYVVSMDEATGELSNQEVLVTHIHTIVTSMIEISLDDGTTLTMTDGHPMLTTDGWKSYYGDSDETVKALGYRTGKFEIGDELIGVQGNAKIVDMQVLPMSENTVFNLTINNNHTYAASDFITHNSPFDVCYG